MFVTEANLSIYQLQELSDQVSNIKKACEDGGLDATFNLRIELKGDGEPDSEALKTINTLLQEVSKELKIS